MRHIKFAFLAIFLLTNVYAETQPKFTITPTSSTNITLQIGEVATAQFRVTNQTKITRQLVMASITNIEQVVESSNDCQPLFTLAHGQSCLLTLKIYGSRFPVGLTAQPIKICKTQTNSSSPDPFLCSETSANNDLNIRVIAPPRLSATPSILTLTTAGSQGSIIIRNLSTSQTANNIQAYLNNTDINNLLTQDASDCTFLSPGQTCNLIFTPTSTPLEPTTISISGSNTSMASAYIEVTPQD